MKRIYYLLLFIAYWVIFQFMAQNAQGQTGQAFDFDGINDALVFNAPPTPFTAYTIQVRVLFKGSVANKGVILMTFNGTHNNWSHQIRTDAAGHFEHALYDQGDQTHVAKGVQVYGTTVAVPNQWYNVTITATNYGLARLYVNGVEEGSPQSVNVLWTGGSGFFAGCEGGNSNTPNSEVSYLDGQIDEIRVWNTELPAASISQNSNCSIVGSYSGLINAYNFNQGIAGGDNRNSFYLDDISGNSHPAHFEGAALIGSTSNLVAPAGTLSTVCSLSSINLSGGANGIINGSTTTSTDNNTNFGVVAPGAMLSKTYTIRNNGTLDLHISSTALTAADPSFSITAMPASVVTPGSSTSFTVRFAPTVLGEKTATVHLASDAVGAADFSFAVSGISGSTLPVRLSQFDGVEKEKSVLLQWTTASEEGTDAFKIERSTNGGDFSTIGTVAASGNANVARAYSFEDKAPASGINYYRLRMVDRDGQYSFSRVMTLNFTAGNGIQVSVLPNLVHGSAQVSIDVPNGSRMQFVLYNAMGQLADRYELNSGDGRVQFTLNRNGHPSGAYYYQLVNEKGLLASGKLQFQ